MAIVGIDPPNWKALDLNVVQLDSDAADNKKAAEEIEDWAAENDFARVNEYWLRQIIRNGGKRVFRGICYRLTKEEMQSNEAACQSSTEMLAKMPMTSHQVDKDR